MTITRLSDTEFQIECEGDDEAAQVESLTQFEYNGGIYFVKRIVPGLEGAYSSFFVVVK